MNTSLYRAASEISLFCRLNLKQKIEIPIRHSELGVLLFLYGAKEDVTPMAVSDFMGISRPCATVMLKRLENDGYIFRQPSQHDKRSCNLLLTGKGCQIISVAHQEYCKTMQLLESGLGTESFEHFLELIEKSNQILRQKS